MACTVKFIVYQLFSSRREKAVQSYCFKNKFFSFVYTFINKNLYRYWGEILTFFMT